MTTQPDDHNETFPRQFGHYRLLRLLGRGGQGSVHLAEDLKLNRQVALKLLPAGYLGSAEARLRLEREAEAAARVSHNAIARIFEIGVEGDQAYLAMEYVEGSTLAQLIDAARKEGSDSCHITALSSRSSDATTEPRGPGTDSTRASSGRKEFEEIVAVFEAICAGLEEAHRKGLVHRDLKPGNVIVRADGSPVIIDFGLAQASDSEGVTLTRTGQMLGTPSYMPPEQIRGEREQIDARSDVYALGVTLFECCTLERPFSAPSREELIRAITQGAPQRPRALNPRIHPDLEAIILTAIDRDPKRRYASAEALAEDLARFRRLEPIAARPIGPIVRTSRWLRRNAIAASMAAIVIAALLAVTIVSMMENEKTKDALAQARRSEQEKAQLLGAERLLRAEKERLIEENLRLLDAGEVDLARRKLESFFPPSLEHVPALKAWLERCAPMVERLPRYEKELEALRARALPYTEEDRARDYPDETYELGWYLDEVANAEDLLAKGTNSQPREKLEEEITRTKQHIAELREITSVRASWRFADERDDYLHGQLMILVPKLRELASSTSAGVELARRLLDWSRNVTRMTIEEHLTSWRACRQRILASAQYGGLELEPQLGLIPLGPDPESELEEFLHWHSQSGDLPKRDPETGRIEMTDETGIIFVLVPGGSFFMGAQHEDPEAPNHDPLSRRFRVERPVHRVQLDPYFLSKYEMTQGQWLRLAGENPSKLRPGFETENLTSNFTLRHPVENVTRKQCRELLRKFGLDLPSESEWERAARAGEESLRYAGTSEREELVRFANIAGSETDGVLKTARIEPGHADSYPVHAPVGIFEPNAFGFHDMTGNVWEFCLDNVANRYSTYYRARGLRAVPDMDSTHNVRGGSCLDNGLTSRVSFRLARSAEERTNVHGVRPARMLD